MIYKIEFQYKAPSNERPEDCVQDEVILFEKGESIPIPNVGDSVSYLYGGKTKVFKALTRHFSYLGNVCVVNIVVSDIASKEINARLKD